MGHFRKAWSKAGQSGANGIPRRCTQKRNHQMNAPFRIGFAALCLALAAAAGLPQIWAYSTAAVRTGSSGAFQVVAAQPSGGTQPLVYCTAGDVTINRGPGAYADIPITCFNGLSPHAVTLSISYGVTPNVAQTPTYSPTSPISLTVSGTSASTTLRVTTAANATRTTYTVSYTAATTGTPAVQISGLTFQSQFIVQ